MMHIEHTPARSAGDGLAALLRRPLRGWRRRRKVRMTAAALRWLDDHTLRDIGLRRDEVGEARRLGFEVLGRR